MPYASIADLRHNVGQTVSVRGWVMTTRSSGKIAFLVLRDGTGYLQAVFPKNEVVDGAWDRFATVTHEANVLVTGRVREDARAPGGYELTASDVTVVAPSVDYPITPKEHGTAFLFEHRHLWLRSRRQVAIAKVRNEVEHAIADFFYDRGFMRVDTPILTGSIGEQAGELFATEYFDLGQAYLAQTGQLYVEAAAAGARQGLLLRPDLPRREVEDAAAPDRVLDGASRKSPSTTATTTCGCRKTSSSFIVARALERGMEWLKELERDTAPLEKVTAPFARISYTDAIAALQAQGSDIQWGADLGADDETALGAGLRQAAVRDELPRRRSRRST